MGGLDGVGPRGPGGLNRNSFDKIIGTTRFPVTSLIGRLNRVMSLQSSGRLDLPFEGYIHLRVITEKIQGLESLRTALKTHPYHHAEFDGDYLWLNQIDILRGLLAQEPRKNLTYEQLRQINDAAQVIWINIQTTWIKGHK